MASLIVVDSIQSLWRRRFVSYMQLSVVWRKRNTTGKAGSAGKRRRYNADVYASRILFSSIMQIYIYEQMFLAALHSESDSMGISADFSGLQGVTRSKKCPPLSTPWQRPWWLMTRQRFLLDHCTTLIRRHSWRAFPMTTGRACPKSPFGTR